MPLDERKLDVLKAIVEDYVSTNEPVGSKVLAERHALGVSPATVRNDMAVLEEEGYIAQPHTSAGRVPTDKGYRLFVDRLSTVKPLSGAEKRAIGQFLTGAVDLDDVIHRSVRLLAQLTRQVAVVQYPRLTRSSVRHVELVELAPARLLIVLITDTGRVEQRIVHFGGVGEMSYGEDIARLRDVINNALVGVPVADAANQLAESTLTASAEFRVPLTVIASVLAETVADRHEERVILTGTSNLAALDFPGSIHPILQALEEQMVLLKLFGEVESPSRLQVTIGGENKVDSLRDASVVTAGYGAGNTVYAGLGVLGPTRMDYPSTLGAVRAVARYVGDLLSQNP